MVFIIDISTYQIMSNFGLVKGYIQKHYNGKSPYHVYIWLFLETVSTAVKISVFIEHFPCFNALK